MACGHLNLMVYHAYTSPNPKELPHKINTSTQKMKNFQPGASQAGALLSWTFDNICEHAGRCQKALTVGFYRGGKNN